MHPEDEHDRLAELLSSIELPPVDTTVREAIFLQTSGVLRRRRWLRQTGWIVALATCWAFGVCSVLAWQAILRHEPVAALPGEIEVKTLAPIEIPRPAIPAGTISSPPATDLSPQETPFVNDQSEPGKPFTTFEKMRRAGDRQLNERGNVKSAIGCYRRALDVANEAELQIVPERDSWLLMSLKEARLETRKHVH